MPLLLNMMLIMVLVLMNGFFVAAEFAMVKLRGTRINSLFAEGRRKAKFASHLTSNLDAYLAACQLGMTVASLGLGYVGGPAIANFLEPLLKGWFGLSDGFVHTIAFLIAFSSLVFLHLVLGRFAPKTLAVRHSENVTLLTAVPLMLFHKLMYPLIWFFNGAAGWLLRRVGVVPASELDSVHTEEEIRILMKESHRNGLIDHTELTLMDNIFDFAETCAKEIMIPRTEMCCLYTGRSFEENKAIALKEMRTRFPVCDNDKDNIIGFVHIKDFLNTETPFANDIRQLMRPITTVPESMQISMLLKLMQKKKTQIAILIDEYGGTSGLVTLEDIMEEIVGEIQDEFDEERPDIEKKTEDSYSISGLMLIEEVNSFFGLEIISDGYDTIGGWIYSQIEIPPKKQQKVDFGIYEFIIEETDHLRISRLAVRKRFVESEGEWLQAGSG
ncbi:hemolysin family protein [Paenibacillus sp. 1P07SE]|uniref:hemolysin family protein n=1 Tax=Paenibacillus sp. 1P07SE TaxID=3132209 RepID=UPI0039A76AB4